MKVKELIEKLQKADPEMDVVCTSNSGEYSYGLVNTAKEKVLTFYEDCDDPDDSYQKLCFVIDEE